MLANIKNTVEYKLEIEKIFFWSLFSLFFLFMCLYGYFVNSAISSVVSREKNVALSNTLRNEVASLEYSYINLDNKVNEEMASSRGFSVQNNPIFVKIGNNTSGLTLNQGLTTK